MNKKAAGVLVAFFVLIIINLLARIEAFADFYTDHIYKYLATPLTGLTGIFHFPIGEPLIVAGIILSIVAVVFMVIIVVRGIRYEIINLKNKDVNKKVLKRGKLTNYLDFYVVVLLIVAILMTANCSIPYGCSKMDLGGKSKEEYTIEDLVTLSNMLAEKVNTMYDMVDRDENGNVVYNKTITFDSFSETATAGGASADEKYMDAIYKEVYESMNEMGDEFPRLKGYYPYPKQMMGSIFMYESGIVGVYFPFSRESYYSRYLAPVQRPATIAHEYAHLKGYMSEDEANFIGFVACMNSDDVFVSYSGYLNAFYHVYYAAQIAVFSSQENFDKYGSVLKEPEEGVFKDLYSYNSITGAEAEEDAAALEENTGITEEQVNAASEKFTESYIDYYDGKLNYDEVTWLLLQYYIK